LSNTSPAEGISTHKLREQPEAKELTLVSIVQRNGRYEARLLKRNANKPFILHKGDRFEVGKSKITITNIDKSDIEFTAGGERWQLALGKTLYDAATFPSDKPHATKAITLKQVDPESLAGILRNIYPKTVIDISYVPDVGMIIRGRKDQVEDLHRIAALLDGLDKGLKNDREIEAIDMLLALKRKRNNEDSAAPPVKPSHRVRVYALSSQTAEETAKVLKDVLKKVNASADIRVAVDQKHKNRIIVSAPSSDFTMISALIILLHQNPEEPAKSVSLKPATSVLGLRNGKLIASKPIRKNLTSTETPAKAPSREIKIIPIKYAVARELSDLVFGISSALGKSGILSVAVDSRTNSIIIVSESESDLNYIEALIQAMDRMQEQLKPTTYSGQTKNPFARQKQQSGDSSKKTATIRSTAPRKAAAGLPVDLIRLTEAYSNAYRELQLAKAKYDAVKEAVKVNTKSVTAFELRTAEVGFEAAQRKLGILIQIAEVEILTTIDELKNLNEQLPQAGSPQVGKTLKRQLRDQQFRQQILKQLISR
jgi:hypothetical protein